MLNFAKLRSPTSNSSATLIVQYQNSATFSSAIVNSASSNSATSNRATLK